MSFADSQSGALILYGQSPAAILLAGTATKGDALGFSSGWKRALATAGSVVQMRCVAAEDGVSGQTISAYFGKTILSGDRITGATAGGAIYVAEGSASGQYTQTAPSTSTDATTIVGYALNATELILIPNTNVDSVA